MNHYFLVEGVIVSNQGGLISMNKPFYPEKYGMILCPICKGKGFVINPERQCCQKCGGFGYIKK